jgi:alpha-L-rhamnosidase
LFDHLTRTAEPGYGHFLERGETTWPEYWNVDVPSRIHTCYTGVSSWLTKGLAGIRPDPAHPGFQSFLIQPVVAGDLTFAEGQTESPYGTIRSRWERNGGRFILEVTIPPNSQATVHFPAAACVSRDRERRAACQCARRHDAGFQGRSGRAAGRGGQISV